VAWPADDGALGVSDPAAVQGSDEQKTKAFRDTALILKRRIELLLALPLRKLVGMSLQRELDQIGKSTG
jgi:arsenate reductase